MLDPQLGGQSHLGVGAYGIPNASTAALDVPEVVDALGMMLGLAIYESVMGLKFAIGRKDGVYVGATPVGQSHSL